MHGVIKKEGGADAVAAPAKVRRGKSILELGSGDCRWPMGDVGSPDFCYCGNGAVALLPYCLGHARIAYRPAGSRG